MKVGTGRGGMGNGIDDDYDDDGNDDDEKCRVLLLTTTVYYTLIPKLSFLLHKESWLIEFIVFASKMKSLSQKEMMFSNVLWGTFCLDYE